MAKTVAKGMARSKPMKTQMIIAPEASGMPYIIDETAIEDCEFDTNDSDNHPPAAAKKKKAMSTLVIKSRFLL